jgi:hypothetical protein
MLFPLICLTRAINLVVEKRLSGRLSISRKNVKVGKKEERRRSPLPKLLAGRLLISLQTGDVDQPARINLHDPVFLPTPNSHRAMDSRVQVLQRDRDCVTSEILWVWIGQVLEHVCRGRDEEGNGGEMGVERREEDWAFGEKRRERFGHGDYLEDYRCERQM